MPFIMPSISAWKSPLRNRCLFAQEIFHIGRSFYPDNPFLPCHSTPAQGKASAIFGVPPWCSCFVKIGIWNYKVFNSSSIQVLQLAPRLAKCFLGLNHKDFCFVPVLVLYLFFLNNSKSVPSGGLSADTSASFAFHSTTSQNSPNGTHSISSLSCPFIFKPLEPYFYSALITGRLDFISYVKPGISCFVINFSCDFV